MSKKKITFVQVAVRSARVDGAPRSHLTAVDTDGRIWERFSDMPSGEWGQVEPPIDPGQASKRRVRKS